jgi:hypothetical protein
MLSKPLALLLLILTALTTRAGQIVTLHYEPKGLIVQINIDSLKLYTDTSSVFLVYRKDNDTSYKEYNARIKNLILKQQAQCRCDTVVFGYPLVPFNDGVKNEYEKDWYIPWLLERLIKERSLLVIDGHHGRENTLTTKRYGSRRIDYVARIYLTQKTKEEVYRDVLFIRLITPRF